MSDSMDKHNKEVREERIENIAMALFEVAKDKVTNPEPGLRRSNYEDMTFESDGVARDEFRSIAAAVLEADNSSTQNIRIEKLEERLEITHAYDYKGNRVEIPPEDRDEYPDGIDCRDETIRLLQDENNRLKVLNND